MYIKQVCDVHGIYKTSFAHMPLQTRKTYFVNYFLLGGGVGFGFCLYSCIPLMHTNIKHKTVKIYLIVIRCNQNVIMITSHFSIVID